MNNILVLETSSASPANADEFYRELTTRNSYFVPPKAQVRLRSLKVLVAGCGAAGGACIVPLARLGVEHFQVADNGVYELNNLNRQRAFLAGLGQNKAIYQAQAVRRLNPYAEIEAFPDGISTENVSKMTAWADLVIDAVDVTTQSGIAMKVALHEAAHAARKPLFCPLDPGFAQWGMSFDYRDPSVRVMGGRASAVREARHPLKALMALFPMSSIPPHTRPLLFDLLTRKDMPASQLGCSADLLSSIMAASVLRFAKTGELVPRWYLDLAGIAMSRKERINLWFRSLFLGHQIRRLLRKTP